ncbi:MAG TPA: S53 family peptidase [Amycolatopsis sp.]|nr:S53 family peptidase [Amycolatopsis sp.]
MRTLVLAAAPLVVGALVVPATAASDAGAPAAASSVQPNPDHIKTLSAVLQTMTANYSSFATSTPGPQDILDYRIGDLWLNGVDGSGTTIALLEGWDDPQIGSVIHDFDQKYGLPDPDIQTIYPSGALPAQCPPGMVALGSYGSCSAWAGELRLDVEAAHLVAPYAKILISATPADSEITDDAASQVAPPEFMRAIEDIASNHLANAISISDGTGESTYSYGKAEVTAQDPGPLTAAAAGIPVLVATGDCGVLQNLAVASSQCGNTTKGPDTAAWDDSPWVTAVGGSVPNFSSSGTRLGPDPLWHSGIYSEGAGYSAVYGQPDYQRRIEPSGGMRSVPDITMDAQRGTSESAPLFAGVLALAAQLKGGDVGPVDTALYSLLGPQGARGGIADVVSGNNSVTSGNTVVAPGFSAGPGFDVASGWGTIDAATFVPALVAASRTEIGYNAPSQQAGRALAALQHGIQLTSGIVQPGDTTYLLAPGFLPQHPVELDIDGKKIATLTANTLGSVSYLIDPAALALPAGPHTVTLRSMLLTASAQFRSV